LNTLFKNKISSLSILIVIITAIIIDCNLKNWQKLDRVIESDIHWYYAYLPATFIYDDIMLERSAEIREGDYYLLWPTKLPNGNNIIKTSMGTAMCYAPFFFGAHFYANIYDYPTNGFSEPYKIALLISSLVFLLIGLIYVQKILRLLSFKDLHIAITILLLGVGTNLLCYASQSAPMSHVYSFALFAMFIYYSIKWHENSKLFYTIIIGLSLGLISLIRPTNGLIVLFFILYNINTKEEFINRLTFFIKKIVPLILIAICVFLVWFPQLLYWKKITGQYLFYSYIDEHFYFLKPNILKGLFSFQKGWYIYTPMMLFATLGIFFMRNELKKIRLSILLFLFLNIYIIFSWWCWWYGGTFGQRSMVDSYALMAIPLAAFVRYTFEKNKLIIIGIYSLFAFFIWLNIFQTYQFEEGSLHYDGMTRKLYFKQFGKLDKIPDFAQYVQSPNYELAKGIKKIETTDLPPIVSQKLVQLKASNGKFVCADGNENDLIFANRETADLWEQFTLTTYNNQKSTLVSYKFNYLSSNLNEKNQIDAIREKANDWEMFTIEYLKDGKAAIKAANKKYFSVDEKTEQIFASSDSIGKNELFEIIILE